MSQKTLYISKPGGALLQHKDGETVSYDYGQVVDLEVLSSAQLNHLAHVTTTDTPAASPPQPNDAQLDAAMAEAGAVNTTASPVPGNYGELSEDQAVRLVQSVRDPAAQAVLIAYEMAHANRGKVVAAVPDEVQNEASIRQVVAEFEQDQIAAAPQPDFSQITQAAGDSGTGDDGGSAPTGDAPTGEPTGDAATGGSTETPGGSTPPPSSE